MRGGEGEDEERDKGESDEGTDTVVNGWNSSIGYLGEVS
jgi:hypothetical protein